MRYLINIIAILFVFAMGLLFSCNDDDDEPVPKDDEDIPVNEDENEDEFDARINNHAPDSLTAEVLASDVEDNVVNVLLSLNAPSAEEKMKRIYITQNTLGQGDVQINVSRLLGVNANDDGSLILSGDQQGSFALKLNLPLSIFPTSKEGTVVLDLWTTSGRGDYRDQTKRKIVGPATLTLNLGGANPEPALREYPGVRLYAPRTDLQSKTFVSTASGEAFKIAGDEELSFSWDFGYFYGASSGKAASFSSTSNYEAAFEGATSTSSSIDVDQVAGTDELNDCFFAKSSRTDFATVVTSANIDDIQKPTSQEVTNLAVGDVIEFEDKYGKKGLILIKELIGTNNSIDYIIFDMKVQP